MDKKSRLLPGIRVSQELYDRFVKVQNLLQKQGLNMSALRRISTTQLVEMVERGECPVIPFRIMSEREALLLEEFDASPPAPVLRKR